MDADVVIIGAGIIGLSIARELKRGGLECLVLERGTAGREASWAGAGMLAPNGESFADAVWTRRAYEALAAYPEFVRDLHAESGVPIDFRISGTVEFRGGKRVEFPAEAQVNPRDVVAALLRLVSVRENCNVDRIRSPKDVVEVGSLRCRAAVVAAGAWSGQLAGLPPCFPVRGHLIGYDMPAGSLGPILRSGHTYILQRGEGFTIVGSTEEDAGFDRSLDQAALADLRRRGEALWPELHTHEPVEAWIGFRPATPSGMPEVGRLPDSNIWLAYGHFRNGILLASVTARMIASEIISSLRTG